METNKEQTANTNQEQMPTEDNSKQNGNLSEDQGLCPICLNPITNRAVLDNCFHDFCFACISEWSQQHHVCPSCRQPYNNIMYNITSEQNFELMPVGEPQQTNQHPLLLRLFLMIQITGMRHVMLNRRSQTMERLESLRRDQEEVSKSESLNEARLNEIRRDIQAQTLLLDEINQNIQRLENSLRQEMANELILPANQLANPGPAPGPAPQEEGNSPQNQSPPSPSVD